MRTTIDLPPELMQAAKVRAARRGEPLKDLFTRAVAHEVGMSTRPGTGGARLALPLIGSDEDPKADFDAEDIERYGP
jgi:hypothetical protein